MFLMLAELNYNYYCILRPVGFFFVFVVSDFLKLISWLEPLTLFSDLGLRWFSQ